MAKRKAKRTTIAEGSGNVFIDCGFPPKEAKAMLEVCDAAIEFKKSIVRCVAVLKLNTKLWRELSESRRK